MARFDPSEHAANRAFAPLLDDLRALFDATPALRAFCALPQNLTAQPVAPNHIPAADLMFADPDLTAPGHEPLRDHLLAAGYHAHWRWTYADTYLAEEFRQRFGCYCLIGYGGAWQSDTIAAYMVYMPRALYYPFHHHPAEEMYYILAGHADFTIQGQPTETLGPGDHVFHPSGAPHATETRDHPMLALVFWRNEFDTPPVLTYPEGETPHQSAAKGRP